MSLKCRAQVPVRGVCLAKSPENEFRPIRIASRSASPFCGGKPHKKALEIHHAPLMRFVAIAVTLSSPGSEPEQGGAMSQFQGPTGETPELRKLKTVTSKQLLTMAFPPRKNLLDPWLPQQGLAMVFAKRGVGKTHVGLGIAYAVASGGRFLNWQAPEPAGVLYVDGEMPARVLKERLTAISRASDVHPPRPEMLRIVTPDLQPHDTPSLTTYAGGMALAEHMHGAKLIVLDNLSTLCRDSRENEAESWVQLHSWSLKLRRLGKSVLFIHHAVKVGE